MTQLVGIVNITPDSFSDGGRYDVPEAAYNHAQSLMDDGAEVIDIGAESTRPDATPLDAETEWERLAPALPDIIAAAHARNVVISLDTRHAHTAQRAIHAGVDWINDVSFGASDALLRAVAESNVHYVAMHSLGVPADKRVTLPTYMPAHTQVKEAFVTLLERLEHVKLERSRVILDVGIGFGKNAAQSLSLIWDAPMLSELGCRIMVGHSRKSCFQLLGDNPQQRDASTLLASSYLIHRYIDYLRVHDIRTHVALRSNIHA